MGFGWGADENHRQIPVIDQKKVSLILNIDECPSFFECGYVFVVQDVRDRHLIVYIMNAYKLDRARMCGVNIIRR